KTIRWLPGHKLIHQSRDGRTTRIPWGIRSIPNNAQPDLTAYLDADIQPDPITICFVTAAGITGHIITIALFLMVTSSLEFIRRSYFEVFWYTHHLFIVFLVGLAFHQFQRLLPVQTNIADHDPQNCSQFREVGPDSGFFNRTTGEVLNTTNQEMTIEICPPAEFTPAPATVSSSEISLLHSVDQALLCTYYVCMYMFLSTA
ncbi:Cytochrome b-245 heavy chain, partial [Geodia barretti]